MAKNLHVKFTSGVNRKRNQAKRYLDEKNASEASKKQVK